ncbi:MAG: glycoside hydrolase family 3 C-terminal domain-containing protein [Treponema sp.]|nr:glycoside hydrolase family 3 C-terminal domain-containing protein [Treponema sp.]
MNKLTLDEKIRLFNGVGSWETYSAEGKLPHIFMSDGPHGLRKQDEANYADLNKSKRATCFPTASCIACSWDVNAARKLGQAIADEALAEKVNLVLGPGVNIKRSPLCGRNFEYFSEDPHLAGHLAAAYVEGMQEKGVGCCLKHFACNNQEKRRQTSSSNLDEKTLRDIYLRAFEYVVKNARPASIMCSYNKINGVYAGANHKLLTEILRDEWGFDGAVISDWGACIDAAACLKAGLDLAMPDSHGYIDSQLKKALADHVIEEADLDRANERVLKLVERTGGGSMGPAGESACDGEGGLAGEAACTGKVAPATPPVDFKKQHQIALQLAQNSAVLLKNDGMLPLTPQKITVIGQMAEKMKFQGGGSSHINSAPYPNALEALKATGFDITYSAQYNKKSLEAAEAAARRHEPILFFCGLTEKYEGEGFDRSDLLLPPEQVELISGILEHTHNVAVISFSGAPIDLRPAAKSGAVLHMYLAGEACGEAIANLISGKVNPSGHLAETWPLCVEDTPSYKTFAPDSDDVNYSEGSLVGYRWYDEKKLHVEFPFGWGLSYTTFKLSVQDPSLSIDTSRGFERIFAMPGTKQAVVTVENTGERTGSQLVQVYMEGQLCGFSKVEVTPGARKTIIIELENYQSAIAGPVNPVAADYHNPLLDSDGFTLASSMGDMAKASLRVRMVMKIFVTAIIFMSHKGKDDPSVKIAISAIKENPLESLISTSGGMISEKFALKLVKMANGKGK